MSKPFSSKGFQYTLPYDRVISLLKVKFEKKALLPSNLVLENHLMSCGHTIMNVAIFNETTLNRINNIVKNRCQSIGKNFCDNLERSVKKTGRFKIGHPNCLLSFLELTPLWHS